MPRPDRATECAPRTRGSPVQLMKRQRRGLQRACIDRNLERFETSVSGRECPCALVRCVPAGPSAESPVELERGMAQLPRILEPITVGKVEMRNRVVMTGHGTGMARSHLPSEQHAAYYAERAKGGVALIGMAFPQIH